jgi:hypothetical protein
MVFTLHTAKELYGQQDDMEGLRKLGFSFEDWGGGFSMISGSPQITLTCAGDLLGLSNQWGELLVCGLDITLLNWMQSPGLVGE